MTDKNKVRPLGCDICEPCNDDALCIFDYDYSKMAELFDADIAKYGHDRKQVENMNLSEIK